MALRLHSLLHRLSEFRHAQVPSMQKLLGPLQRRHVICQMRRRSVISCATNEYEANVYVVDVKPILDLLYQSRMKDENYFRVKAEVL